jgi:hypothetical protein
MMLTGCDAADITALMPLALARRRARNAPPELAGAGAVLWPDDSERLCPSCCFIEPLRVIVSCTGPKMGSWRCIMARVSQESLGQEIPANKAKTCLT